MKAAVVKPSSLAFYIILVLCSCIVSKVKKNKRMFLKNFSTLKYNYTNPKQSHGGVTIDQESSKLRLSKAELGNISWHLLHSFAASFPTKPSEEEKQQFKNLLISFTYLYPCLSCRRHFKEMLESNPIEVNSREQVSTYLCNLHNLVNQRIGKAVFDCNKILDYWGGKNINE